MGNLHRAWKVCLGCAFLIFVTSGLVTNAFSIYLPYILSYNHFTNTQVSTLITARSMTSFITTFLTGVYYNHIDLRRGMTLAGACVAVGFLGYGLSTNYWMYVVSAIVVGIGYGLGTLVPIGMILNRWFESDLSLALGICGSVTGLTTLGLPTLITILVERIGLGKTFLLESVFIILLILCCYLLLANSPEEIGCQAYYRERTSARNEKKDVLKRDAGNQKVGYIPVMDGKMWILMAPMTLCIGGFTSTAYIHLSVFMTSLGISPKTASFVILVSGIGVTSSKLMYGWMGERIGANKSNWLFGSLSIVGLFLCFLSKGNPLFMGASIVIYSLGLGMTTVGPIVWARELSSKVAFERNNRLIQVGYAAGGLIFSTVPGMIADAHGGSFKLAILLFAGQALFTLLAIQYIYFKARGSKGNKLDSI